MKTRLQGTAALLATWLLGACATQVPAARTADISIDRGHGLALVNAFRSEHGLKPLTVDDRLMQAAAAQSEAMARRDKMDHMVAGALPGRVESAGYRWGTTAENIARGYKDYDEAMVGWINSPSHRKNLLNPDVTQIGFAGARTPGNPRPYWAQILASPSKYAAQPTAGRPMRWGPALRFP
ncbi:CAP domain-containing protein [Aureimonas sp. SK2]|uniref:CAP domain-containing protein n=1 Tax=Aureimonas sp. SK2 TaxID=3015992 RepID=UPI0024444F85|nr:CAP domain-containing protein [Aureimonas sp. SK2]